MDIEKRSRANGKFKNLWRIIAFVGTPDLKIAQTQRMHHLRGAGDKGDDSHSLNIPLAFLGCFLLGQQVFQFLGLPLRFALRGYVQEADLELDFRQNMHTFLISDICRAVDRNRVLFPT